MQGNDDKQRPFYRRGQDENRPGDRRQDDRRQEGRKPGEGQDRFRFFRKPGPSRDERSETSSRYRELSGERPRSEDRDDYRREGGDKDAYEGPERTLKRVGEAQLPRQPSIPQGMAQCDICAALVPGSRLEEHKAQRHSDETDEAKKLGSVLEHCPQCGAPVRADRLERHLQRVHPD